MNGNSISIALGVTAAITIFSTQAWGADRGRLLYENHCVACHESRIHIRKKSEVKEFGDIEIFARRFSKLAGVEWSDDELLLVVNYLNRKYYKFDP